MGQRANLITVENGDYVLRYDHWCANRLDDILFWGPDFGLEYFEAQDEVSDEGWLDELWAEGGGVIDLDNKHLIFWGGEDLLDDVLLRRTYLRLQNKIWNGWSIEWAHRGIVDIAEYVGFPKETLLTDRTILSEPKELHHLVDERSSATSFGSFKSSEGEIKIFVLPGYTEKYLFNGVDLVDQCRKQRGSLNVVWSDWQTDGSFPQGGFWVDERGKTVEFWQARDCPNVVQDLKNTWEGWEVIWHQDRYEFVVDRLSDRLVLPKPDEAQLIARLSDRFLREDGRPGVSASLDFSDTLKREGIEVEVNRWMTKSHHVEHRLESKKKIWDRNFGA